METLKGQDAAGETDRQGTSQAQQAGGGFTGRRLERLWMPRSAPPSAAPGPSPPSAAPAPAALRARVPAPGCARGRAPPNRREPAGAAARARHGGSGAGGGAGGWRCRACPAPDPAPGVAERLPGRGAAAVSGEGLPASAAA